MQEVEISEKKKVLECIKALSRIDGVNMTLSETIDRKIIFDNLNIVLRYFEDLLKDLDK